MSKHKNISQQIKNSFEQEQHTAPKSIWDKIEADLGGSNLDKAVKSSFENENFKAPTIDLSTISTHDINEKVKESFESQKQTAPSFNFDNVKIFESELDEKVSDSFEIERNVLPDSIWRNVQNKMDVSTVWKSISPQIKINTFSWTKLAVASIMIGFISLIPTTLKNPIINLTAFNGEFKYENTQDQIKANDSNLISNQNNTVGTLNQQESNLLLAQNLNNTQFAQYQEQNNEYNSPIFKKEIENINQIWLTETPTSLDNFLDEEPSIFKDIVAPETKENENLSRFSLGFYSSINNTWLNDEDTRNSFNKNSLLNSKIAFGESRGLIATYTLNNKIGITGAFLFQSKVKNKIGYYENGFYKLRTTELNYTKGFVLINFFKPLTSKISKISGEMMNSKIVFGVGPYVAYQKNSLIYTDDIITNYNSTFKDWDNGIKLQFGKEHQWNSLTLGYGLNSNIGLKNIEIDPANIATNINAGVYAILKYQLF